MRPGRCLLCSLRKQQKLTDSTSCPPIHRPVQGLLQKFRPEVIKRIRDFNEKNGTVLYGGRMAAEKAGLPSPSWPENTIPKASSLNL